MHHKLQAVPAPEPSSQFNWMAQPVIEAFNGVFAGERLEIIPGDTINVPSGSQVTGQEKRRKISSIYSKLIKCLIFHLENPLHCSLVP